MSSPDIGVYQRLDERLAKLESIMAVVVLLSMVFVASAQALFFNIAQQGVAWAQAFLEHISWADMFLQKGTLWLAFLGASLAAHEDKHIGIDVLPKLVSPRIGMALRSFAALGAGIIALGLAFVFYQACVVADAAVPFEYEVLTGAGAAHVCDASAVDLGQTPRPGFLCLLRSSLASLGVPVSSGGGIAQLITPVMLLVIAFRLIARGIAGGLRLSRGEMAEEEPGAAAAVGSETPPEVIAGVEQGAQSDPQRSGHEVTGEDKPGAAAAGVAEPPPAASSKGSKEGRDS